MRKVLCDSSDVSLRLELKAHALNCTGEAPMRNRWGSQNVRGQGSDNDVMRCERCSAGFTQFDELQVSSCCYRYCF